MTRAMKNRLADLQVIGYDLDPDFDKDNYKINKPTTDDEKKQGIYTVNVESEKDKCRHLR